MDRQGVTAYRLWKLVEPKIGKATLYEFLHGSTAIGSDAMGIIFDALELQIVAKTTKKAKV